MVAIFIQTFSNAFSWMKMYEFLLRFHWSLLLRVQLTIFQLWFRQWLGSGQATSHCLNQWWLFYWHIYASLCLNELNVQQKWHLKQDWKVVTFRNNPLYTLVTISYFIIQYTFISLNKNNVLASTCQEKPGDHFNIKMLSYKIWNFHYEHKTVSHSYLRNGNS